MAPSEVQFVEGFGGARIAWRELGEGRPVVLFHGYFSDAATNWIRYGHAAAIAARGFRVILPDLRGHGESDKPHDAAAYPPDVAATDGFALIEALGLTDYDLGGYSLGARTTVRMLAMGAKPRRVVLSGMGLEGIISTGRRVDFFRRVLTMPDAFERGSAEWLAQAFLKTTGGDAAALVRVLDTFVDTPAEALQAITQPVLVVAGADDFDNGSAEALAAALPNARHVVTPGNHMSAVLKPELGQAIADFLAA
ncbi:alpha/beta fold hydrolase [Sphingomonas sp. GlSt437]|uniref:alpha/beta fold hydrolase n=1 Tax=Sphingomonas sp. GlSt437 TaxID=3389970 RepID=UPI003A897E28